LRVGEFGHERDVRRRIEHRTAVVDQRQAFSRKTPAIFPAPAKSRITGACPDLFGDRELLFASSAP
jgi:hypothetical protein